jgi:hypothetical protein
VLGDQPFDGGGKVPPKVEAVSDLHRVRRPGPGTFGIGACPVTTNHLGRFALQKPLGERRRIPSRDQIDDAAALAIDENGAVVVSSFDGEVVDAEHAD